MVMIKAAVGIVGETVDFAGIAYINLNFPLTIALGIGGNIAKMPIAVDDAIRLGTRPIAPAAFGCVRTG